MKPLLHLLTLTLLCLLATCWLIACDDDDDDDAAASGYCNPCSYTCTCNCQGGNINTSDSDNEIAPDDCNCDDICSWSCKNQGFASGAGVGTADCQNQPDDTDNQNDPACETIPSEDLPELARQILEDLLGEGYECLSEPIDDLDQCSNACEYCFDVAYAGVVSGGMCCCDL